MTDDIAASPLLSFIQFFDLCDSGCLQLTFVFLVLPCLLLGYLGQAAYLIGNPNDTGQAFFSSIPSKFHVLSSTGYEITKYLS